MDDADLADFTSIADENGEISKTDLIVHTKASSFWRSYMESKSRPGAVTSKVVQSASSYLMLQYFDTQVEIMASTERSEKTKTAFKLFDKNKDGFITRQEFLKVCRKTCNLSFRKS